MYWVFSILGYIGYVACLVGWILVLIAAFQDKVTKGLLSLFIIFYAIFYAFARYQKSNKTIMLILFVGGLGLAIVANIIAGFFAPQITM